MFYAIKINVDEGTISFSKAILQENKKSTTVNFCFTEDNFSFYFSKKDRANSRPRYKIDKETKNIISHQLCQELTHTLNLQYDWKVIFNKGEIQALDNYKDKREYVIYLEKLSNGLFRALVSDPRDLYHSRGLYTNKLSNLSSARKSYLFLNTETGEIVKKYINYHHDDNYKRKQLKIIIGISDLPYKQAPITDNYIYLGGYLPSIRVRFNLPSKQTLLSYSRKHDTLNRTIPNHLINENYLFEKLELIEDEAMISYLSFSRFIKIYFESECRVNNSALYESTKRQTIRLTKYLQAIYPELSSEQIKEKSDVLTFKLKPGKPDIREVKGDDIVFWYNEQNYLKELGSGPLTNSCMRGSQYSKYIKFYAKNENCSLLICTIGDKLIARALVWTCQDGARVMDRPYVIRDQEFLLMNEYRSKNNISFVYDFRTRTSTSTKGFSPDYFSGEIKKDLRIKLDYIPENYISDYGNEPVNNIRTAGGSGSMPYLDNFCCVDTTNSLLLSNRDLTEYKKQHSEYFQCEVNRGVFSIKNRVSLFDGRQVHEGLTVHSNYHKGLVIVEETVRVSGDYIQKDLCRRNSVGNWVLKDTKFTFEDIVEDKVSTYKVGDQVICVKGSGEKGSGWELNHIFTIDRIEEVGNSHILWGGKGGNGVLLNNVMPYTELKVGDKVKIAPTSEYYGRDSRSNPAEEIGIISRLRKSDDYFYNVEWKDGGNAYRHSDLILVSSESEKVISNTFEDIISELDKLPEYFFNPVRLPITGTIISSLSTPIIQPTPLEVEQLPRFINQEELEYVHEIRIA